METKLKQNQLEELQTKLVVNKAKLPEGEIEAILSTDDLDRHGEHVSINGLVIPKGQVIKMYYNHQTYGDALPIGKWTRIWKSKGKLMGHGQFDLEDAFAYKVYRKVQNGFIDSISIGFYPQEYDGETSTWTKSTLVEASIVAEPANVAAVITSKELGFTQDEFNQSLKVKLKEVKSDLEPDLADPPEEPELPETSDSEEEGATDTELKTLIDEMNSRLGAVEETLQEATANPAKKNLIKVRLALKQVGQSADQANRIIKVKLKDTK